MRWRPRLHNVTDHLMSADELCSRLGVTREQLAKMFMSAGDVTALWNISPQRLDQLTTREGGPVPIAVTRGGKIYLTGDIHRYAQQNGRPLPAQGT